MNFIEFKNQLSEKGFPLTALQEEQFHQFFQLLIEWNEKMNLTAITKFEEVIEKHFYDSLTPIGEIDFDHKVLVDIGAGAGFPSIPLKILFPNLEIIIIDSLGKRMIFINEVIKQLKLTKIQTKVIRGEEYARQNLQSVDIVTARAVARLNILCEICIPLLKIDGTFIAYKGADGNQELKECQNAIKILGGRVEKQVEITLPTEQARRINIFIKKSANSPSIYPREFAKIKGKPLK